MARWRLPDGFRELSFSGARVLQGRLAARVREEAVSAFVSLVAGADVAHGAGEDRANAAVVVWDVSRGEVVETATASVEGHVTYVPGMLAWRELPALMAAFEKVSTWPQLVLVDAHGRAHPRRCGLACLLGLALDLPTVGCAKSVLVGRFGELPETRGAHAPLRDGGEVIGAALRTRAGVRPVFVSVGHRVTLEDACSWVLRASRFRIPEPLRAAHAAASRLRAAQPPMPPPATLPSSPCARGRRRTTARRRASPGAPRSR